MNTAEVGIFSSISDERSGLFVVGGGAAETIDKGTCVIYSQGPERLTKMSGNKASCYFLTAVQTCIDRNLAPQIKMRL